MPRNAEANLIVKIKETGTKALSGLQKSYDVLKISVLAAGAAITGVVAASIAAYRGQEKAVNTLEAALKAQGLEVTSLSKKYQDLATAIQKRTTFGDEEILQAQSLAQSMVGNIALTDDLIRATVDFAAAQGVDLNSAFNLVGKSIGSNLNALGRYGIEIDSSANRSEKMAAITQELTKRFKGSAEAQAQGLGSLTQMKNAMGDVFEVIGQLLAPAFISFAKIMTGFFEDIQIWIPRTVRSFKVSFLDIGGFVDRFLVQIGSIPDRLADIGKAAMKALKGDFSGAKEQLNSTGRETAEITKRISDDIEREKVKIDNEYFKTQIAKVAKNEDLRFDIVKKSSQKISDLREEATNDDVQKDKDAFEELYDLRQSLEERALQERIRQRELQEKYEEDIAKREKDRRELLVKSASESVQAFTQGGFQNLASHATGFIANTMVPGIGGAVQGAFQLLTKNSDDFIKTITNMLSAEFIGSIIENLATLSRMLPDLIIDLVNYLTENLPALIQEFVYAFIQAVPQLTAALIQAFVRLAADPRFGAELAVAIAKGVAGGFLAAVDDIAEAVKKAIKQVGGFLGGGGGGGGGGVLGSVSRGVKSIGKSLGFSHGGFIPGYATGGPVDQTLARFTPGEYIVNRDSSANNASLLEAINNSNGRTLSMGSGITINVYGGMLGDKETARQFAVALDEELLRLRQGNEAKSFDAGLF